VIKRPVDPVIVAAVIGGVSAITVELLKILAAS
jgi:hypothetical protein